MPAPAARTKAKAPSPRDLCRELLEIERDNPEIFRRIEEIKISLKLQADQDGSFRETFEGLGYVSVSPSRPAETIGEAPEAVIDAWNALSPGRRDKLIEQGVIRMAPIVKGASYGQVRTKLHASPQGAAK